MERATEAGVGGAADGIAGGDFGGVVVGGVEAGALVVDDVGEGEVDGGQRVDGAVGDEVLGIEAVFNGVARIVADYSQAGGWWGGAGARAGSSARAGSRALASSRSGSSASSGAGSCSSARACSGVLAQR